MSAWQTQAHVIGLFFVRHHRYNEEKAAWDFTGIANTLYATDGFPVTFVPTLMIGITGYGQNKFSYEIRNIDGVSLFRAPEEEIDLKKGRMMWRAADIDLDIDVPSGYEAVVYINGKQSAMFPFFAIDGSASEIM